MFHATPIVVDTYSVYLYLDACGLAYLSHRPPGVEVGEIGGMIGVGLQ